MLRNQQFQEWCNRLGLSNRSCELVQQIRSSEPIRRVGSRANNVCGRYPSQKMGRTIQFESHKVELPAIEDYETDDDVLEYYDQPLKLSLSYESKSGRRIVCSHVPDFFVIRQSSTGFEEWKPEARLKTLTETQPNRYCQSEVGGWYSPPAEQCVQALGVYYRLRTDREINWTLHRNRQFLRSYLIQGYSVDEEVSTALQAAVCEHPGITFTELIQSVSTSNADDINALIATQQIYVDLKKELLAEPERVHLFQDSRIAEAYAVVIPCSTTMTTRNLQILDVAVGKWLSWDGKSLMILQRGATQIVLRGESDLIQLSYDEFSHLVQQGSITSVMSPEASSRNATIWKQISRASPADLEIANHRYRMIEPYLQRKSPSSSSVCERTIRNWKAKFRIAQETYGWGYIGLLPHQSAKGNRHSRLLCESWEFIDKIIEQHYETLKQQGKMAVYGILLREWEKTGFATPCPSRTTFSHRIQKRAGYHQTRQRQGKRAAYQHSTIYHELTLTTPCHGDRPFEVCHIDHTELDIELVCIRTGRSLGRPWATVLMDAFCRRILAIYLSFDCPSYRSCMMVLRLCVQRFGQFPETIVVDNGAEFGSIYFETLLAAFECTKKQRPAASPRFGSLIERLFGTTHTEFFYNLRGNTQITKCVRQMTTSNDPKRLAVWTLAELYEHFCWYAYEVYDQQEHPALGRSPREAFLGGMAQSGSRSPRNIVYDENFQIFTLPSTAKGTAKVQAGEGVKINYLHYWSIDDSFLQPSVEGIQVPVRYDPFDMGTAYAYVDGQWVRCISEHYALLQGRSEREVRYASLELRQQKRMYAKHITVRAKEIAEYLESAEAQEALQLQRLHDLAVADSHKALHQDVHSSPQISPTHQPTTPLGIARQLESTTDPKAPQRIQAYHLEELW
jgi:putative transposase